MRQRTNEDAGGVRDAVFVCGMVETPCKRYSTAVSSTR